MRNLSRTLVVLLSLCYTFSACHKAKEIVEQFKPDKDKEDVITFYTLGNNKLFKFSTSNPSKLVNASTITGLQTGEKILGIDFRPATGELYALGSTGRLYTINFNSGNATLVAALTTTPAGSTSPVPLQLSGTSFGFDFNPVVDRIRIISNSGQNLRAHPVTGVTVIDAPINPQGISVNSVAYDNNDTDSTTGTELYAFETAGDKIYEIDPPNAGVLIDPLPIGLNITGDGGFDIAPRTQKVTTDVGLAIYMVDNKATLFRIDVETGETKVLARYNDAFTGIAISAKD